MITVVVADDHLLFRAGLVALLSTLDDVVVVAEAADGREAVALAERHEPDVVVMDLRMPVLDGVAATRRITAGQPTGHPRIPRVLALTTFDDEDTVYGALRAGASGYLVKSAAPRDLVAAVRSVSRGDGWIDPTIVGKVLAALSPEPAAGGRSPARMISFLTPRENEILALMARGLSNSEIRSCLTLSEATVKTHVGRIIAKTGSRDRAQAVVFAYEWGLVVPGAVQDSVGGPGR